METGVLGINGQNVRHNVEMDMQPDTGTAPTLLQHLGDKCATEQITKQETVRSIPAQVKCLL